MTAPVRFEVQCDKTLPGLGVFVTGGHDVLGNWSQAMALPLTTTAETFPCWHSATVDLPVGRPMLFKYLMQMEDRSGAAQWEILQGGNRSITPTAGVLSTLKSSYGSELLETKTSPIEELLRPRSDLSGSKEEQLAVRQAKEKMLLKLAESCSDYTADISLVTQMGRTFSERDPMKRNFSQTLLSAAFEQAEADSQEGAAGGDPASSLGEKTFAPPLRGIQMKHCMSFSALEEAMTAEEKNHGRTGNKSRLTYEPRNLDVPIVIVTSELAPWSKSGGLGQVAGSYMYEFPRAGHRTMVVAPKYKEYDGLKYVGETKVYCNGREQTVRYLHKFQDGCDCIFVEHPSIQKPDGGLYNASDGTEYPDNLFRFTLLSLAALEAPLLLNLNGSTYGDKVLFLANDWQAGLVPLYLNHKYRPNGTYTRSRVMYVVHNIAYQGQYHDIDACSFFGVTAQGASDLAMGKCVNLCKAALVNCDRIIAVSPNYVHEIQTPELGFGVQDFVRAKAHAMRLGGILNGIDDSWNPETDKDLEYNYCIENFEEGKAVNKSALQKQLFLNEDPDCALMGFVGRLAWQKGVDVIGEIIDWLMQDTGNGVTGNVQLIMMGNGEAKYADVMRSAESRYPGRICGFVGFDPKLEHQILAACDIFLMPSRYEPCGLPQMYAMVYGTIPIVTATGGLKDTVKDISEGPHVATGFQIQQLNPANMKETVYKAADLYLNHPIEFRCMQRNGMSCDFYWPRAMDEYERHIDFTLSDPPAAR